MIGKIPDHEWAFTDLALGFYLREGDILTLDPAPLLNSGGDWEKIVAIHIRCRSGDFSMVDQIVPILIQNDDSLIWDAGINLLGFAGDWRNIVQAHDSFISRLDGVAVRYRMALLFGTACDVRSIEPLLDLYLMSKDPEADGDQTIRELSLLLEPADNGIFRARHEQPTYERVIKLVDARLRLILNTLEGNKLFESEALNVVSLAQRLRHLLDSEVIQRERFYRGRLVFEAATGINCNPFFDERIRLNRLAAMGILDEFLESDLSGFIPGQRYFFRHPIPD